ncbi:MAG: flagellar basal body protein [Defluviitaleaceae bacterium]|nr:flagellar basal body protein [Defluviitaleaceae bacterium]
MNRGFNTAISGLNAARTGLAVTGHNMANVTTVGYTRQQALQHNFSYQNIGNRLQVGMGNDITMIRQVRDRFLDLQFRGEIGRMAFHGVVYTTGNRLEEIYGELQSLYSTRSIKQDLWESINELTMHPSGIHTRRSFISTMQSYITKMNNVNQRMINEQDHLDLEVRRTVTRINQITTRINQLNGHIGHMEMSGQRANDFRDERNLLLDELSRLIPIEIRENTRGEVLITTGGNELVAHGWVNQIGLKFAAPNSHLVVPVFTDSRQILDHDDNVIPLFRLGSVGPHIGNDNSELLGLLTARGLYRTDYRALQSTFVMNFNPANIPLAPAVPPGGPTLPASWAPPPAMPLDNSNPGFAGYLADLHNYISDLRDFLEAEIAAALAIPDPVLAAALQSDLDDLEAFAVNVTGTGVSLEVLYEEFNAFDSGVPSQTLLHFNARYGIIPTTQREMDILFNHTIQLINDTLNGVDLNGNWGVPIFVQIVPGQGYTMGNVQINPLLLEPDGHNLIGLAENQGTSIRPDTTDVHADYDDGRRAQALLDLWSQTRQIFEPIDGAHPMSINDAYRFVINNLSTITNRALTFHNAQVDLITELDNRRISMSGVSMDEEMRNMMMFQHAFNAASRIVNVIDSMIDRVINGTGRVGL